MKTKKRLISLFATLLILYSGTAYAAPLAVSFDYADSSFTSKEISGQLTPNGPEQVYQFEIKEKGKLVTQFYEDASILFSEFYTTLKIKDHTGKILRESTLSGKECDSTMTAELEPGKYYYTIKTNKYGNSRTFQLKMTFFPNLPYDNYVKNTLGISLNLKDSPIGILMENAEESFNLEAKTDSDMKASFDKGNTALFAFEPKHSHYYQTTLSDLPEYVTGYILDENFNVLHYTDYNEFDQEKQELLLNTAHLSHGQKYYILLHNTTLTPLNGKLKISPIPEPKDSIDTEFNDILGSGPKLIPNKIYSDQIRPLFLFASFNHNDRDWYNLELSKDTFVLLKLEQPKNQSPFVQDLRLSIFDENKVQVSYTDISIDSLNTTIPVGLKKGKYYIRIEANTLMNNDYDYNLPYKLSFSSKQESQFADFESNNHFKNATMLNFNQKIHAYFNTFYDKDMYKITLPKKMDLNIKIHAYDDFEVLQDARYRFNIYDSKGNLVQSRTAGMCTIFKMDWIKQNGKLKTFTTGLNLNKGTYYIEVSPIANSTSESMDTFQIFTNEKENDARGRTYWLEIK